MAKFDPAWLPAAPDLSLEKDLWEAGFSGLCGLDESGRGALAGPVAAAGLVLPPDPQIETKLAGVRDSKTLSPLQREKQALAIEKIALVWGIGFAGPEEVDAYGILPATRLAMGRALEALTLAPDFLLVDHILLPEIALPQAALTKGDARSLSIAGASILAKVARDRLMRALDSRFPGYGFARHKGYGTRDHRHRLHEHGPSPIHRMSFAPLRESQALEFDGLDRLRIST